MYSSRSLQAYEDECCSSGQEAEFVLTCHRTSPGQTKLIEGVMYCCCQHKMNFGTS